MFLYERVWWFHITCERMFVYSQINLLVYVRCFSFLSPCPLYFFLHIFIVVVVLWVPFFFVTFCWSKSWLNNNSVCHKSSFSGFICFYLFLFAFYLQMLLSKSTHIFLFICYNLFFSSPLYPLYSLAFFIFFCIFLLLLFESAGFRKENFFVKKLLRDFFILLIK